MPRPPHPSADGLVYHVVNRGNGSQSAFFGDDDYLAFLNAIGDRKERRLLVAGMGRPASIRRRNGRPYVDKACIYFREEKEREAMECLAAVRVRGRNSWRP